MNNEISNTDDIIDLRDVFARVEELRGEREVHDALAKQGLNANNKGGLLWENAYIEDNDELQSLEALLAECREVGGGYEQWEGHWYPVTLIRDSYFKDYARALAGDMGALPYGDAAWPNGFIDWEKATEALQQDYSQVEFDGETYWTR